MTKRLKILLYVLIALTILSLTQFSTLPLLVAQDGAVVIAILSVFVLPMIFFLYVLVQGIMIKNKESRGEAVLPQKKKFIKTSIKVTFFVILVAPAVMAVVGGVVMMFKSCSSFSGSGSRDSGVTAVFGVIPIFFSDRTISTIWAIVGPVILALLAFEFIQWLIKNVYVIIEKDF
jgi:hypothetical protein